LDDAYAAGLKQARIIHGKGTGALRRFVNDYLKNHPVILSLRSGDSDEGGQGVTVVTFKEN
jgi:DNA mismatch repair protein MutS2